MAKVRYSFNQNYMPTTEIQDNRETLDVSTILACFEEEYAPY
jgi:hypothetical protein